MPANPPDRRASRWLVCRVRRPEAGLRLYCFPHSGASPGEYVRWADHLTDIEVVGVQAPGRGGRLAEPPFTRMSDLVTSLVAEAAFDPPFAFFGQSLGALTAYEVARALRERGLPRPVLLFVSALGAPHLQPTRLLAHGLDDEQLVRSVEGDLGRLPDVIRDDPEMLGIIVGCLRADFEILDTYRHTPGPPLDVPILALGGAEDEETAHLPAWAEHSAHSFGLHVLPGGHFYLREQRDSILRIIVESVSQLRDSSGA